MEETDEAYIKELELQNQELKGKNIQQAIDVSSFASATKNENLIQYQIENVELLEKLEHFYK